MPVSAPVAPGAFARPRWAAQGMRALLRLQLPKALVYSFLIFTLTCTAAHAAVPTPAQVRRSFVPSDTLILSREGEVLQRQRTNLQVRRGEWVALEAMSPALRLAMVASEDQRFYAHSGVDWQAVSAAAWGQLWHRRTRGASTITMQLAGLLDDDWRMAAGGRSVGQKLGQAVAATQLERHWRKDEILEAYLNWVPFRGELVGIDALSRTLFGKAPHGLDGVDAAIAAALVRGPNASPSLVAQRACGVWQQVARMVGASAQGRAQPTPAASATDCSWVQWRTEQALRSRLWPASEGIAPHWARRALQEWRGLPAQEAGVGTSAGRDAMAADAMGGPAQVRTTVSALVQRVALESLQRHLRELQGRHVEDGAVLVLDNASGQVLAWVGSSGGLSQASEVDGVLAWRQPGSTLKPFLYAQAIAQRRLTAASLIEDSAAHIDTGSGLYIPQNYDRRFQGWVTVRTALAASLNVPAVRTLAMVTPDAFFTQLHSLGLPLRESAGYYGYSLALGSAEVPLYALTQAYRSLANGGQWSPPVSALLPGVAPAAPANPSAAKEAVRQALPAGAAFIVGDILADRGARAGTFGLDSVLGTRFWTAVKTGTSKDMRDNWALGWSQRYTVGVWVGNASGAPMHGVSGSSGAAPIWADVMAHLHAQQPSRPPAPPPGVVQLDVRWEGGSLSQREPPRREWLLAGTEQAVWTLATAASSDAPLPVPAPTAPKSPARILYPVAGTVIALDPDIPPAHQQLRLQASSAQVRWQHNGRPAGRGATLQWGPVPGRHTWTLYDARGRRLDEVVVDVRGAGLRDTAASASTGP